MKSIPESDVIFGPYDEKGLFHIEKSELYKSLGEGLKTLPWAAGWRHWLRRRRQKLCWTHWKRLSGMRLPEMRWGNGNAVASAGGTLAGVGRRL